MDNNVAAPDELQTLRDEETRLQKILEIREMEKRVQRLQALTEEEAVSQMSDRGRSSIEREDSGSLVDPMEEPPTRKRRLEVSDLDDDVPMRTHIRTKPPPEYKGRNIKEHKDFVKACEVAYRLAPTEYPTDAVKVLYAVQYLTGEPSDAWDRHERERGEDNTSWEEFKQLLNEISDPVNRRLNTVQQFEEARQRSHQKVQEFVTYLERLEAELPPYTEEQRRQHLFAKLKPELRHQVTNFQDIPETRSGLIALAVRLEENMRRGISVSTSQMDREDKPKGYRFKKFGEKSQDQSPPGSSNAPRDLKERMSPLSDKERERRKNMGACYRCGKPGHYATACGTKVAAALTVSERRSKN
jgi:hypothetical protein